MELLNFTPFPASISRLMDPKGQQFDLVVVSATFIAHPARPVELAKDQAPIREADSYYGDPGLSSVRFEAEVALQKPRVDVIVNGSAVAPGYLPTKSVTVSLKIGDIDKQLLVSGDRRWRLGLLGPAPSEPQTFVKMPIIYERAFGGIDQSSSNPAKWPADPRNPIGVGFRGAASSTPAVQSEVPNIEYPSKRIASKRDKPLPAGFGIVARNWQPRISYAGTFDDAWKSEQFPLLPEDFNLLHNQAAPADQQSGTIAGGEQGEITNMTPEGDWRFALPVLDLSAHLWSGRSEEPVKLRMDTVILEPDDYRIILIARAAIQVVRSQPPIRNLVLGHMSNAWRRAQSGGKRYLDYHGTSGRSTHLAGFRV